MPKPRRDNSFLKRCRRCNRKPEYSTNGIFHAFDCPVCKLHAACNDGKTAARKWWNKLQIKEKENENNS